MKRVKEFRFLYEILCAVTAFVWGVGFIWVKDIMTLGMTPDAYLALRYLSASLLYALVCFKQFKTIKPGEAWRGVLIGALLYLGMMTQTAGLTMTTPSNSAFITTVYVVLVPFVSWILMKHRPRLRIYICAFMCVVGLYFLTMKPGEGLQINLGNLLTLLSAVFFAVEVTAISHYGKQMRLQMLVFIPLLTVGVLAAVVAAFSGGFDFTGVDLGAAAWPLLCSILLSTIVAQLLQTHVQRHMHPARASIIFSLESVFACICSVVLGYDDLTLGLFVGGAIIFSAIIFSEFGTKPETDGAVSAPPADAAADQQ